MNDDQPNGNPWIKSLLVWGGIFLALLMVVSMFGSRSDSSNAIRYSDFRAKVADGSVAEVQIGQDRIVGKYRKVHLPGHAEYDPKRTHQHLEANFLLARL